MSTQAPQVEETLDLSRPSGSRTTKNGVVSGFMILATALAIVPLAWLLASALHRGLGPILHASWWANTMDPSLDVAKQGALHAIVGTLVIGLITSVISIPIALLTAIFLVEYARGTKLARVISFAVDVLTGVPSIVAALFIYAVIVSTFHGTQSAWAASLALVILMVPTVLRSTEEMLKLVPDSLREASYALGVPKWKTIARIVLPTALSGIVTGIMLAIARVMGESSPVLVLVGSSSVINWDAFKGSQSSLPLMMLDMYKAGAQPAVLDKLWGAALTLVILIAVLNIAARIVSAKFSVKK